MCIVFSMEGGSIELSNRFASWWVWWNISVQLRTSRRSCAANCAWLLINSLPPDSGRSLLGEGLLGLARRILTRTREGKLLCRMLGDHVLGGPGSPLFDSVIDCRVGGYSYILLLMSPLTIPKWCIFMYFLARTPHQDLGGHLSMIHCGICMRCVSQIHRPM